ncbi:MAG: succinate dehydrogenase/fumarate reductase iron-sulfur subunit [Methanobacterium sp. ERen5]|nr:MAG: succinate dehydrogenase/fumarate reductase iron-sulfur subunit [Methanobacterium sp. ERen5]
MIKVKILRQNPRTGKEPYFEVYDVEESDKMKILDALNQINNRYDADIAYRYSCRAGQCGSCALKMNNKIVLACKAEIEDGAVLEPLDFEVLKDLVVERSKYDNKVTKMDLFVEGDCIVQECPQIMFPKDYADTKKIRSCIECLSCLSACPVVKQTEEFAGPYFMRYISKFALDPRDCADRAAEGFDEGLYTCTSCGKCKEVCPKEINTFGSAIEKLREISVNENIGPLPAHKKILEQIKKTGRSVEPSGTGDFPEGFVKTQKNVEHDSKPKIALFTGCMVDYKLPEIAVALLKVMDANNIDVIVPDGQICCGSPLLRTGQTEIFPEIAKRNYEALKDYDTIVTVCAGCGSTLKNDYPKAGINLNVKDISEFLADKLETDNMKPVNMKVCYHDPCHLIRGQGISKEPREVLNKIKGVEFVEMEVPDQCCGAGGGVRSGKPEIAAGLGSKKVKMVEKLDVDAVITICPFCEYNIQDSLDREGLNDVKAMNILKLLEKAYE